MSQNPNNTIHQLVTAEKLAAIDEATTALEHAFDFLVGLSPEERLRLRPFGPSNEAFLPDMIEAAGRNVDLVPPQFSAAALTQRREATTELFKRALRLQTLLQHVQDTARLVADGCVGAALDLYHTLKRTGRDEGLDATVARMSRRFARAAAAQRKANQPPPAAGTPADGTGNSGAPTATPSSAPNVVALPAASKAVPAPGETAAKEAIAA